MKDDLKQHKFNSDVYKIGEDYWNDACINWDRHAWGLYAMGYEEAADILVKNVKSDNSDLLIYPIAFLYRQAIELQLKDIILTCRGLYGFENEEIPKNHDLLQSWSVCKKAIEHVWPKEEDRGNVKEVEKIIREIHTIDKKSFSFRYPVDKNNAPLLPQGLRQVSIKNLSNKYKIVIMYLNGAICGIDAIIESDDSYSCADYAGN